ncbi:sigma-70 family RNA polymerase sigma factor [Romboutsia sp.]|uniref:sigma-70 family RNA polymerase sigma factor n=1 Tax=Romboutsia sp. TaxID=1965302 RepID=UPI003F3BD842
MNEYKLIENAKLGCNESFATLLKSRSEKMYKVAFYYVKNESIALDIVSEATYKAYINLKKLNELEYFDTWLIKIVKNESMMYLRKHKREIPIEDYKENIDKSSTRENLEANVDIHMALDKLNNEDKEIMILKYFGDLTFKDIGKIMLKPENTIKTRHYRALEQIKQILQGG